MHPEIKILIVEDEDAAANRIKKLLLDIGWKFEVLAVLDTIKNAVAWFHQEHKPDLIFMDIQLADGISFEIFEYVDITSPIIFTTAYNEYALKAFKVNSVDYLLKPLTADELKPAMDKFEKRFQETSATSVDRQQMLHMMQMLSKPYKSRFIVKTGNHIRAVAADDIQYFFSKEKITYCVDIQGNKHLLDHPLDKLTDLLDPLLFFRLNRQYIARLESVKDIITFSNSRLKVVLHHCEDQQILISREKVNDFKTWLDS